MSPDSDTEDEYSDLDEGLERKLEGHLISLGEPYVSEHLAERKRRIGTSSADSTVSRRGYSRQRRRYTDEEASDTDAMQRGIDRGQRGLPLESPSEPYSSDASSSASDRDATPLRSTRV